MKIEFVRAIKFILDDEEINTLNDAYEILQKTYKKLHISGMQERAKEVDKVLSYIACLINKEDIKE